jgi:Flp pilus assembly protein TadB
MKNAPSARDSGDRPTVGEMLEAVLDLSAALGILLLPLLVTALPGVLLLLVVPAVLLVAVAAVPVAIAAAILAAPYLVVRAVRRRRRARREISAGPSAPSRA